MTAAPPAGLRQRHSRVPAGAARPGRGRRLLGVARSDARRGRDADAGPRAALYEQTPRDARGGLHGGRRVPLRGRGEALAAIEAARAAGIELVLLASPTPAAGCPFPAGLGCVLPRLGGGAARERRARRARRALRAGVPGGLARGDRRVREREGLVLHVHADEQPREIEECLAEHGRRPVELLAELGCSGRTRPSCTRRTRTSASSISSPRPALRLHLPHDRGEPRRRLPAGELMVERGSGSASARTRTSGSTRSRSCGSSRASPAAGCSVATSSQRSGCSSSAPPTAHGRSGSTRGRRSR